MTKSLLKSAFKVLLRRNALSKVLLKCFWDEMLGQKCFSSALGRNSGPKVHLNSEVTRLFKTTRYIHRLHLKVYTRLLLFDVYIKCLLWLIIKWLLLTWVSILHKYLTDETIDSAVTNKRSGVATPVSLQAQYWFERNAIDKLSSPSHVKEIFTEKFYLCKRSCWHGSVTWLTRYWLTLW